MKDKLIDILLKNQYSYDTTKDFSSDGMLKCRQRHIENDSLCHKPNVP